ncbi:MAG: hypothetical protein M1541_02855, partial [Acidobacteria bacterium]|nr:hypothetical protein [Acidobacteriota bacterium]
MDPGASRKLSWLIAAGCLCGAGLALVSVLVRAQNQPGVRLTGYVTDVTTRAPVAGAYLYIADQTGKQVGDASTNAGGYYEAAVPALKAYSVGVTVWVANGDYQVHRYVPITVVINRGDASAVRSDVALQPGASLILNMYDANGQILRNGGVGALTGGQLWVSDGRAYVTDLEDNSCDGLPFAVQDSYAYGRGWDAAIPAFVIPPGTRARIHVLWEVPGFGRILLDADNGGAGYQVAQQGGFVILNFPYEAAKFAVASLRADSASYSAKGYTIPSSAWSGLQSASGHLTTAEQYLARKPQAMTEAVAELNIALKEALWSHEELILEVARSDIQRNRTGTALVRVQDERGQALAGATVVFRQTNRGFLFGANPLGYNMRLNPLQVSLLREAGINHSYVSFPWEDIEPSPGAFRWDPIDAWQDMYGQLNQGFSLLGGMALWMYRGSGLGTKFCPAYQDNMSFPELQRNVREHMRAMAARYKGKIDLWSIDEQNMPWSNVLNLTWDQKIELYRTAIAGMREGNADAKTMFLAPALPYEFHPGKLHDTSARAGHVTFPEFLKLILARGIPVDVIALEAYYAGVNTDGYAPPGLSLVQFSKLLDQYSMFGKPIFFREFIAPSVQHPRSTWWHRPWDEATQAEFAKAVYTIAFSKSLVRQIGWSFGISDDNTFIVGGGLLDKTWNPKPVYFALKELLKSWTPSGEGRTSANGTFLLSGYAGDYDLTITASGRGTWQAHATLREQQQPAALTTAPEPTGPAPVVLSADVASYQERRDGSWFSEDIAGLPRSQSAPDVVFNVKDSVLKNRKNGQISPTLLASYWFIQSPASITDLKVHLHTARALFLRSGLLRFVDYLNNKVWLGDNTSGTIPVDVLETVKLCNENRVPIFLEVNYSDYIPGPTGTTGVGSLVHSDNIANTISFLELLQARSLHVDGITFGDQIGDDNGWGGYKPTVFNSDIASRFIRYASAIKSKFPRIKIYAFETTLGAVYGLLSPSLWNLDADHSCWPLLETVRQAEIGSGTPLIDGFSFTESYVYIDKDGNLLDSQHILDDTESLYRYAPIYRYAIMGESYPRTDPAYLPYIINRITGIFNRPLDFALTEYLPAGPLQISESDTSRYSDMDFILHFSDVVGISAMLGSEVVSRMIFAGSTDQAKCYVDNRGNRGINYPVQEQLATYFEGELLRFVDCL